MVKKERKLRKEELESFTLASAFEMIYEKSCDSKLSPEFYDTCNDAINFVSKELNVTHFQSIILAILANSDDSISLNQMSSYTKCSPIRFRIHKEELDDLHYRHFVQWVMARYSLEYHIRDEFMEAIIDNVPYTPKKYEDYTTYDVYTKIAKWIEMLKRDEGLYEDIVKTSDDSWSQQDICLYILFLTAASFADFCIFSVPPPSLGIVSVPCNWRHIH